jgi:hypothetical protein
MFIPELDHFQFRRAVETAFGRPYFSLRCANISLTVTMAAKQAANIVSSLWIASGYGFGLPVVIVVEKVGRPTAKKRTQSANILMQGTVKST